VTEVPAVPIAAALRSFASGLPGARHCRSFPANPAHRSITHRLSLVAVLSIVTGLASARGAHADTIDSFSHFHFDHTGNANLFAKATWIVSRRELAWASATPTPFGVMPATWNALKSAKQQIADYDTDVFGDGSVRIMRAPGHTPGHQVLVVTLKQENSKETAKKGLVDAQGGYFILP